MKTKAVVVKKDKKPKSVKSTLNPQQLQFLSYYANPQGETFGNLYQSAIKAGYEHNYATQIGSKGKVWIEKWMLEFGRDLLRLQKAEKIFDRVLNEDYMEDALGAFGPIYDKETGKIMKRVNTNIMDKNIKVATFLAETTGRSKYSKKIEVVGLFNSSDLKEYE